MSKILNISFLTLILIFYFSTYKYYSSNKNINNKNFNRNNIEDIINTKISNVPLLKNDTNDVIEFNDSPSGEINNGKKRSFWDLLKLK